MRFANFASSRNVWWKSRSICSNVECKFVAVNALLDSQPWVWGTNIIQIYLQRTDCGIRSGSQQLTSGFSGANIEMASAQLGGQ
jgi:hypothetical protein